MGNMASVILIWLYMAITTFITGYGVLRVITRHIPYHIRGLSGAERGFEKTGAALDGVGHLDVFLMCGTVCVTVYAQFFSLAAGVGFTANVVLAITCAVVVWVDRRVFAETVRRAALAGKLVSAGTGRADTGERRKKGCLELCMAAGLFFLFVYGTSRGMIHYDTGLYHAQSIRWIEEYGAVKGLGNLHGRLAYNSASFALSALYSMAFLGGQSYHCAAGFLALILAAVCLEMAGHIRAGKFRAGDFARVMCVYYLVNIFDEMISPASDYFMVLTAFYIVIRWLDLLESGEGTILPYALLCVLGVFLMTVKLSAALILVLVVYPACRLLREKKWREIALYLGLGIVTALPFFIRNVIISGWLVYPFTQVDLFDVVWKIPKGLADYDAREIQVWGRGYTDVLQFDMPVYRWLPDWFRGLAGSDKVFVLAAAFSVLVFLVYAVGMAFGWWQRHWELLLVQGTVAASFVFWLCTSPLMRYGCVYVYLTPAVVLGGIYGTVLADTQNAPGRGGDVLGKGFGNDGPVDGRKQKAAVERMVSAAAVLFLLYKGFALGREIVGSYVNDYWIIQKDYENYETYPYEINGVTFYCPVEGDRVGYEKFPSSPVKAQVAFLGEGIAEGFRMSE